MDDFSPDPPVSNVESSEGGTSTEGELHPALDRLDQRYRALTEHLPIGVYRTTAAGKIVRSNQALASILGYTVEELALLNAEEVFANAEDRMSQLKEWQEKRGIVVNEFKFVRKDGAEIWIRDTGQAVLDDNGQVQYFDGAVEDITEQRAKAAAGEIRTRMAAVGQLAAGFAHDFNNILFAMTSSAEMLLRQQEMDDQAKRRLTLIVEKGQQAAEMIRQIGDFARQSPGTFKRGDLALVVKAAVGIMSRTLPEGCAIAHHREDGDFGVELSLSSIQQLVENLVRNGFEAMGGVGQVTVTLSLPHRRPKLDGSRPQDRDKKWVVLAVKDTGVGITATDINRIYDPYFTTKTVTTGAGLGLTQVYSIVKQHSGYIEVDSKPGHGTTVDVFLPLFDEPIR